MLENLNIKGDEYNPLLFFANLAKEIGGSWNGEEFKMNNSFGKINSVCYSYLDNLFIGTTEIYVSDEMSFENEPIQDHQYISIRIGKIGDFDKEVSNKQQRDSIYIYNNRQKFKIVYPPNVQMKWLFIRFPKELYDLLGTDKDSDFYNLISNDKPWFFYSPMLPEIKALIHDIYGLINSPTVRRGLFLSKSIEIITKLRAHGYVNQFQNIAFDIHPEDLEIMLQLKDEILADFTKIPNVLELSKEKGMSKSKLQRSFKSIFQMPILQFFNHQRILEGQRLVRETSKEFTQIAFELGYTDLSHFSRVYKKIIGKRPSEEIRTIGRNKEK